MGRRRKDDQPSVPPLRIGRQRTLPQAGTYRVRAYAPTPGAANGRVSWRHPDTGRQTSSVPAVVVHALRVNVVVALSAVLVSPALSPGPRSRL